MLIRSRIVLPMTASPLEDGAVLVSRDRIRAVGRFHELRGLDPEVVDLGDVVVLPGLINSHCHLDYTHLLGRLPPPRTFPDWIKSILAAKSEWTESDYAASWLDGARQLLESGTTSVVNIESVPGILAASRRATPLRVFSHLEMTGVRTGSDPASVLDRAEGVLRGLDAGRGGLGLSPHAPYSTQPELLELTASRCRAAGFRTTTHVAESHAESEMYLYRRGPMFTWLESQRRMDDCGLDPRCSTSRVTGCWVRTTSPSMPTTSGTGMSSGSRARAPMSSIVREATPTSVTSAFPLSLSGRRG